MAERVQNPKSLAELRLLLRAHQPILCVETDEEERLVALLETVAEELGLARLTWRAHRGLTAKDDEKAPIHGTQDPQLCLAFIEEADREAIYDLRGFDRFLDDASVISRLREIYKRLYRHRGAVILSGPDLRIPRELAPLVTWFELPAPTDDEIAALLSELLRETRKRAPVAVELTADQFRVLLDHIRGLSFADVRRIFTRAMIEDGRLSFDDLAAVALAKKGILERTGVLEIFEPAVSLDDLGGLTRLKSWLSERGQYHRDPKAAREFGLDAPKGILLLGVQGCGKSSSARAVARAWELPLVRLDPAHLYQKFVGETEKTMRRALKTVEAMAPVVLWVDELEKAFAQSDGGDAGLSRRVLGSFLSWLQDKKESVFVVATANDIASLPPELVRKGRFDEIFFIDLPTHEARADIFALALQRRGRDPTRFDCPALATVSEGFSGAEIVEAVRAALYTSYTERSPFSTAHILRAIAMTVPLSRTMHERVESLRAWAEERAVRADG